MTCVDCRCKSTRHLYVTIYDKMSKNLFFVDLAILLFFMLKVTLERALVDYARISEAI